MARDLTRYTLLLSSPGDAVPFCEVADRAMQAVNRSLSDATGVELYSTDWRRDSRPDSGAEPQALLNRQIVDDADIVLAIFYKRFGSPTRQYGSGTEEEIRLGLQQKKTVLLYIWEPPEDYEPAEPEQLASIQRLKADLGKSVMYKSFTDENDFEVKARHDLTALMLDLEGGGRPSKPALSVKCIDASANLSSNHLLVQEELAKTKLRAAAFDDSVRRAFEKVAASPVCKFESVEPADSELKENVLGDNNASGASALRTFNERYPGVVAVTSQMYQMQKSLRDSVIWGTAQPKPVEFGEEETTLVFEQLSELGIEPPEDLFYVGELGTVPSFASISGQSHTLVGTDDEKAKYRALQDLVRECLLRKDYWEFRNSFVGIDGVALALANDGGQPASHVCVEMFIPTDTFVPHRRAPVPSGYFIGHFLDDADDLRRFARHLYSIGESPAYRSYDTSKVMYESGGKIAPLHQRFSDPIYGKPEFGQDDFSEEVDFLFSDYEMVEDHAGGMTVVRLSFDRIQQNVAYSFPTVLLIRDGFNGPIRYRITADELPAVVDGELSVNAEKEKIATTVRRAPNGKDGERMPAGNPDAKHCLHSKPMLSVAEQIAHLKSKGVSFDLCSEDEAASYLTDRTYLFKVSAYRELFEKHVGGERDGQYVGLDFGNLCELASLDRDLRYAFLPMTLDVEHYARVKLVREATTRDDEDGYSIVSDYMASLNHNERRRREGEINMLKPDAYCGDLVAKYHLTNDMPLWVFMELVSFGSFISFYLFCANRWKDKEMRDEHYLLRQAKAFRNAAAHSSNVINGFDRAERTVATNAQVSRALAEAGISKRVRQSKMRNSRLQQIVTLLFLHMRIVPNGTSKERARDDLRELSVTMRRVMRDMPDNDVVQSSLGFLVYLFEKWF